MNSLAGQIRAIADQLDLLHIIQLNREQQSASQSQANQIPQSECWDYDDELQFNLGSGCLA